MAGSAVQAGRARSLWAITAALLATLTVLLVAHDVDHVVNEDRLGELTWVFWAFLPIQYGTYAVVFALLLRGHSRGPTAVAALGTIALLAFPLAHLVPFGPLPYSEGDPLAISWALIYVPMAVALAMIATALRLRAATPSESRAPGARAAAG